MQTAALYTHGRVVVGVSHLDAYQKLTPQEKDSDLTSGFFDPETGEFLSDLHREHFFNKKILLIRHGEARCDDGCDPELSETGIKQVEKMKEYLCQIDLDGFVGFTSPLHRCVQTTHILVSCLGVRFSVNADLVETPGFPFTIKNRREDYDDLEWPTDQDWDVECETERSFVERIGDVLKRLPPKCILISHSGFVTNMAKLALCDEKIIECGVPNASITYIDDQEVKCLGRTVDEKDYHNGPCPHD